MGRDDRRTSLRSAVISSIRVIVVEQEVAKEWTFDEDFVVMCIASI